MTLQVRSLSRVLLNTNTDIKLNRHTALKVYEWCRKTYGRSKYNGRYPEISYKKGDHTNSDLMGEFDFYENLIFINSDQIKNLYDLVSTIIHEFTHYKQNMKVDWTVLSKYFDPYTIDHPLEKEASDVEVRDTPKCLKEVFGIDYVNEIE